MNKLLILLTIKALFLSFLMIFGEIHLSPDEAQYWTWGQHLDFGYYSKPPLIAWQIFTTTQLLGNNELGVRFGAIVLSFILSLVIYRLGKNSGLSEKGAFWGAVAFSFSPLGMYLSSAATTDPGAILGVVLAMTILGRSLREQKTPNYSLMGLSLLLGALYKWTAFIFYPFFLPLLFFYPFLRSRKILLMVFISLLALVPSLYWNINHDFATFKHVAATINKNAKGNIFDFLASQIALLSPLYFFLFIVAFFQKKKSAPLIFLTLFSSGFFIYLSLALFKKMQPNWALFFYPSAMVLIGWYTIERMKKGIYWLYASTALALFISLSAFSIPYIQSKNLFYIPYKWNPFLQNLGWNHLKEYVQEYEADFTFADTYQLTSLLKFYTNKPAYFLNLKQNRKNQFSYWPSISEHKGKTGLFVVVENASENALWWTAEHYSDKLALYCEHVEYLGHKPLFISNGVPSKHVLFFRCINYNGKVPKDPEEY